MKTKTGSHFKTGRGIIFFGHVTYLAECGVVGMVKQNYRVDEMKICAFVSFSPPVSFLPCIFV